MKAIDLLESPDNITVLDPKTKKKERYDYAEGLSRSFIISKDGQAIIISNPRLHPLGDHGHGNVSNWWEKVENYVKNQPVSKAKTEPGWIDSARERARMGALSGGTPAISYQHAPGTHPETGQRPRPPARRIRRTANAPVPVGEAQEQHDLLCYPSCEEAVHHFSSAGRYCGSNFDNAGRLWLKPKIFSIWGRRDHAILPMIEKVFELAEENIQVYQFEFGGSENRQQPGKDLFTYEQVFAKKPQAAAKSLRPGEISFPTKYEPHWKDVFRGQSVEPHKQMRFATRGESAKDIVDRLLG